MTTRIVQPFLIITVMVAGLATPALHAQEPPLQIDHYVPVVSTAPSMKGETAQIYVRERTLAT
ncbi:MAG: hypothetical protein ABGY72_16790, partial [bacterium]